MTTAQQVLDVARSQLGTVEARDGSTPYHRAYGLGFDQPWCAVFTWWCFRQAGAAELTHPKTAYTPTLANWYRERSRLDRSPQPGDLVFFDWPDSTRRIQHVGLVEVVEPNAVVTIEGNTSSSDAGSQGNGGGVWRRRRARGSSIAGYGHPAYAATAAPREEDMPLNQQDLEAITAIIRREVAAAVWSAPIPDFYQSANPQTGQHPPMPAFAALGHGTANAARSRDEAAAAADRAEEIADLLKRAPAGAVDYDVLARTFVAELLNKLPRD